MTTLNNTASSRLASYLLIFALVCPFAGSAFAGAQQKDPLTIDLSMKKVVTDAKGHETLQDAGNIKPGDLIEYKAVYRNRGKQGISGLNASLPVPSGLEYVKQSAQPSSAQVTVDGVKFAAEPLMRTIKDKDGKDQQVEIPYSEYRSLRWEIGDLDAGKRIEVKARMRVSGLPASPEDILFKPANTPVQVK